MARTSFGSILSDPLVLGLLATGTANNLLRSYNESQKEGQEQQAQETGRFTQRALASGEIQPQIEAQHGLFGKIGERLGLASPYITASPDELAAEKLALQGQQGAQATQTGKLFSSATSGGAANYPAVRASMGPAAASLPETIAPIPGDVPKAHWVEEYNKDTGETRSIMVTSPSYTSPLPWVQGKPPSAADKGPTPNTEPYFAMKKRLRKEGAEAAGEAASEVFENSKAADVVKGGRFFDMNTLSPIKGDLTVRQARQQGARQLSPTEVRTVEDIKATDTGLDELQRIIDKRLISTKGMGGLTGAARVKENWIGLKAHALGGADPDAYTLAHLGDVEAIRLVRAIQGRYPSQIELKKMESLISNLSGVSREVATKNLRDLRGMVHAGFNDAAAANEPDTDRAIVNDIIGNMKGEDEGE